MVQKQAQEVADQCGPRCLHQSFVSKDPRKKKKIQNVIITRFGHIPSYLNMYVCSLVQLGLDGCGKCGSRCLHTNFVSKDHSLLLLVMVISKVNFHFFGFQFLYLQSEDESILIRTGPQPSRPRYTSEHTYIFK